MKRKILASFMPAAALAAVITAAPALQAQFNCYDSYVTMSGTCPDSCGRGDDCPCITCVRSDAKHQ